MCSCVYDTIFSIVKLDLCIQALLLDPILDLKKSIRPSRVDFVLAAMGVCVCVGGGE